MKLSIKDLRKAVADAKKQPDIDQLKVEIKRVLGPIMDTDRSLTKLAESVNDRISVLERTGRTYHFGFKPSVVAPFMNHHDSEVRTMAARVLPDRYLSDMQNDQSSKVRAAVARRADTDIVREMMRSFPNDEELKHIYRTKCSSSTKNMTLLEQHIEDIIESQVDDELDDQWYVETASKLFDIYAKNGVLDDVWINNAVNNLARASKTTNGTVIDVDRLKELISDLSFERKDQPMSLKDLARKLLDESEDE